MYIDLSKTQDYEKYGGGQGGGRSISNSVQYITYHIRFTRIKAYKVTGLQNSKTMELPCCDFPVFKAFQFHINHRNTQKRKE